MSGLLSDAIPDFIVCKLPLLWYHMTVARCDHLYPVLEHPFRLLDVHHHNLHALIDHIQRKSVQPSGLT